LCILAYKGFTTITNHGGDLKNPKRNIGRSIIISIALCTALYLLITVAVTASLTVPEIIEARDYALAEAAQPMFGDWGMRITVLIAVVATLSGLNARLFSVSKLYDMLRERGQAPGLPGRPGHQSLYITAGLAIVMAAFFDLSQIASLGAILYLAMDIAIHFGIIRRLKNDVAANSWIPLLAIILDLAVLVPFLLTKSQSDPFTLVITALVALAVAGQDVLDSRKGRPRGHGDSCGPSRSRELLISGWASVAEGCPVMARVATPWANAIPSRARRRAAVALKPLDFRTPDRWTATHL